MRTMRLWDLRKRAIYNLKTKISLKKLASKMCLSPQDEKETALETLMNRKKPDNHRFVFEHVKAAMKRCGLTPTTHGPKMFRLKLLMLSNNISETIHLLRHPPGGKNHLFYLLQKLHPTPVVCRFFVYRVWWRVCSSTNCRIFISSRRYNKYEAFIYEIYTPCGLFTGHVNFQVLYCALLIGSSFPYWEVNV